MHARYTRYNTSCHIFSQQLTSGPTTARILVACIPRMADWGGLMMGVPMSDPNTPPLEMVNDPPAMSSSARDPFRAGGREEHAGREGAPRNGTRTAWWESSG